MQTFTIQNIFSEGRPGFIVPVEGKPNQFVVGVDLKFLVVSWDGEDGSKARVVKELGTVDSHEPTNRLNDGKADPRGRLFAGQLSEATVLNTPVAVQTTNYNLYGKTYASCCGHSVALFFVPYKL